MTKKDIIKYYDNEIDKKLAEIERLRALRQRFMVKYLINSDEDVINNWRDE